VVQGQQDHSKWAITIPETSVNKDVKVTPLLQILAVVVNTAPVHKADMGLRPGTCREGCVSYAYALQSDTVMAQILTVNSSQPQ